MNKGIVVTILTVLYFLWNIFAGIKLTWGGILMLIWGGRINIILFLIFALLFILIGLTDKKGSVFTSKYKRYAFPFILAYLFIYFYAGFFLGEYPSGSFLMNAFMAFIFILLNDKWKLTVFDWLVKSLVFYLSLSLIEYLLYIFTDQGILIAYFIRDNSGREQLFEQHLFNFFIINSTIRFQSFCEEPGELGTLCYLMLFLIGNNPRYKIYYYCFWIFGLASFSLGFYILAAIYLLSIRFKIRTIVLTAVCVLTMPLILGEQFETLVMERISGKDIRDIDNRTGDALNSALSTSIFDGSIIYGHGGVLPDNMGYDSGNTGGKVFLYKYGVLGLILLLCPFWKFINQYYRQYRVPYRLRMCFVIAFFGAFYKSNMLEFYWCLCLPFLFPMLASGATSKTFSIDNIKL